MGTFNKVIVCGRLAKDPVQSISANGKPVAKFSLATDDGYGDRKETTWFNCVAFGASAEAAAKYLHKGEQCLVEGRLSIQRYDKDGKSETYVSVLVDRLVLLPQGGAKHPLGQAPKNRGYDEFDDDGGIPF